MRRTLSTLIVLSLLLVAGSMIGCSDEEVEIPKEVLPAQIEVTEITKEQTIDFDEATFAGIAAAMGDAAAGGIALTIRLAVGELSVRITNPNDFEIALTALVTLSINDVNLERPNLTDAIYVPAKTTVDVRRRFGIKLYDVLVNFTMAGYSTAEAFVASAELWTQITAGTPTWDVYCHANISSEFGNLTEDYWLSYPAS